MDRLTDLKAWLTASGQEPCTVTFSLCLAVLSARIHQVINQLFYTPFQTWPQPTNITRHLFTVKQHNTVPWNQVAVDILVWEVNCCCDIIQELKEKENNVKFSSVKKLCNHFLSYLNGYYIFYLHFDSTLIYQTLPNPVEFSCEKEIKSFLENIQVRSNCNELNREEGLSSSIRLRWKYNKHIHTDKVLLY